ncbi:sulfur carrier protein ThiS [Macrococcoides goetzii]|uniref:Thiamine biosynthesis protein ThiS n=2 Tax=Macrococcoides TaxID=3076173 RepID=A0A328A689_9STAP|nr:MULTISPECIES: sulfur carrier protein ThiS [Macrococcus]ATD31441.1 thiamine biosynthesis protein ThiS [Macrococcus sp. IME1552]MBC9874088.1 sulfur carrier protein ThiS [Macrococcus bohemicus]MCG7419069.1 sulfur carrier protein ThiS [Macrococcus epidermidis]MCH4985497.1 sulfur carrier protein ThiS [Macrococcus sp. PK]QRN48823.1 sulfur carrier protein ThiS [Macrococcus bohemicus]
MKIYINDEPFETDKTNLSDLLATFTSDKKRIVALVDDVPIEQSKWQSITLKPEQKLELLEFVGGG